MAFIRFPTVTHRFEVLTASMSPAIERGDKIGCYRPRALKQGKDYLLRIKGDDTLSLLARVDRVTPDTICARLFNPPRRLRLSRNVWEAAYRVTEIQHGARGGV